MLAPDLVQGGQPSNSGQLVDLVERRAGYGRCGNINPISRSFQAVRDGRPCKEFPVTFAARSSM